MKKKSLYIAALLAGVLSVTSCGLDEYNPSGGDANADSYDVWAGMAVNCYAPLSEQLYSVYDFFSVSEGGTDMWICPGGNQTYAKELMYYEGLTTSTNGSNKAFKQMYTAIGSCNAVISHAETVTGGTEANIKEITAEAKTLRAFYYLQLATYYGPITLTTATPEDAVTNPTRNTLEEIYTQITTDLKEAAEDLGVEPFNDNYARVSKKTALGLLARAYAQGAGEGLTENGVSYWQRAKEVAEDLINNASSYGVYLYSDVADLWAQANNRGNKEALFIASGRDGYSEAYNYLNVNNNLFTYIFCNPNKCSDIYKVKDKQNYFLGRVNNNACAPSKYTLDVFDPSWDKRWENSFMTAFGAYSMVGPAWVKYTANQVTITNDLVEKYGMGSQYVGTKISPYIDLTYETSTYAGNQYYPAGIWAKGDESGDIANLVTGSKNEFVIDYPVADDDNRFGIVLSKDYKTAAEKAKSRYFTVNIDDLFDGTAYKTSSFDGTNSYQLFPSLIKYSWNYNGVFNGSNLQRRNGDVMIMRTAEIYLIAAEACQQLGDNASAIKYLTVLRNRAARTGTTAPTLTSVSEETILDEYARELCGEFERWALLKRHHNIKERLQKYNARAAESFDEDKHYNRPISYDFLTDIDNSDEYGDNGYGTTPGKGF